MTSASTRLRRLRLHGFKTFARVTELEIDGGITAVVGPNGSGKSNLVDAIRWALGETSARELRGARMDEVIHNGGPGRPAMGRATVGLVLDNESGRLPVEDAEVEIARRVTRHGDSEYRLNGARLRLRDLERILGSTGLTQAGYAVVAQNDVESIVDATPSQRRSLVEEAAGVRGLRAAREDALGRVGDTEGRLLRLSDLLADAETRVTELAGQVAVALEQRELVARLAELRGSLAREAWRAARSQARRARSRLSTAQSRAEAAREAEAGFAARIASARSGLAEALRERDRTARALEAARIEAERAGGDRRRFEDQAVAAGLQRAAARHEEAVAGAEAAAAEATVAELSADVARATAVLAALSERRIALRTAVTAAASALASADQAAATAATACAAARARHDEAVARAREHEARAGLLDENATALAESAAAARARLGELAGTAASAARESETLAASAAAAGRLAGEAADRAAAGRDARAGAEAGHAVAAAALREAEARAAAIHGQVAGVLGGGAVDAAVARGDVAASRLVEAFRVLDPSDHAAVEAALEGHLGAWLTADVDAAVAALRGGRAREEVLAAGLEVPGDAPAEPSAGLPPGRAAATALDADPAASGALALLLEGAWLVDGLEAARAAIAAGAAQAVLADGTVVTAAGIRVGGRPGEALALAAAEQEAQERLLAVRADAARAAAELEAADTAANAMARDLEAAASRADVARAAAAAAAARAAGARAAREAEEERGAALVAEQASRQVAAGAAREAAAVAGAEAEWAAAAIRPVEERLAAAAAVSDARRTDVAAAEDALRAHDLETARAEPRARDMRQRIDAARDAAARAGQRTRLAESRLGAGEDAALVALARAAAAGVRAAAADSAAAGAAAESEIAGGRVPGLDRLVQHLEAERSEVAVTAARAADEVTAAASEAGVADARVAELADAVRSDDADEGPEPDAADAERVEREIVRLERRVGALGPVNALAPEQHSALLERTSTVRADHDDLAGACADLRAIADHVAAEIEGRFDAVFGAVGYHFQLLFSELFPGGHAALRLEQPELFDEDAGTGDARVDRATPRQPGVEILAQPPGKRLQNLSLLSGGERALTALAVILALQQVNPSPFYVFDEVDAPLDDANIGRFTRLLRRLATEQQFLVVTHNHATMAAADSLYGVTMGTDGVSRIISVRLVAGEPVAVAGSSGSAAG